MICPCSTLLHTRGINEGGEAEYRHPNPVATEDDDNDKENEALCHFCVYWPHTEVSTISMGSVWRGIGQIQKPTEQLSMTNLPFR